MLRIILNTDEDQLVTKYENERKQILNKVLDINPGSNVFFPLCIGGAGDIALQFIYLKEIFYYLSNKGCHIYIISQEKFCDIINLIAQYFNVINIKLDENNINYEYNVLGNDKIKKIIEENKGIFFDKIFLFSSELFYKTGDDKRNIFGIANDFSKFLNKELNKGYKLKLNKKGFNYDKKCIKNVKNYGRVILCNYESKSLNMPGFDKITFNAYLKKTYDIGKDNKKKVVINSVYNREKQLENDYLSVRKLSFQEVIYLADNNLIEIFVSERNGLNDVIYVFFPGIKQIIYYPEGGILTKLKKQDFGVSENYDISAFNQWKLPQEENIIQDYRKNFFNTIQNYINRLS